MRVAKALIIADPWIGFILDGSKTWEMRSSGASHRGWFGLIRKGSRAVYGIAWLVDVGAPLSPDEMIATFDHHRIPEEMIRSGEVAKWNTPWKLADVRKLASPVPYGHKSGAVTWVELDEDVSAEIARQSGDLPPTSMPPEAEPGIINGTGRLHQLARAARPGIVLNSDQSTPVTTGGVARIIGEIVVTEGNITHNHMYLRSIFDKFPANAVGGSNKASAAKQDLTVDWGGPEPVITDLDGQKKFFRARGWVGAFYKLNRARAGDKVRIEEIAPYRFRVSVVR